MPKNVLEIVPLLAVLFFPLLSHAELLHGMAQRVADGDTVTVEDADGERYRVRLAGIDAPERKQPFGKASTRNIYNNVFDKKVVVDWYKKDRWGRLIGKVMLNGRDLNYEQVAEGYAWHFKKYAKEQTPENRKKYADAEQAAIESKRGLWQDKEVVAPWAYRKTQREKRKALKNRLE